MDIIRQHRYFGYVIIAAIVIFPIGNWLTEGTEWGRGGSYSFVTSAIEAALAVLAGFSGYQAMKGWLRSLPDEVWFSTDAQLKAFDEALASASWMRKALGRYRIRDGAAYTCPMSWMKIPIVLVSRGELDFNVEKIAFSSRSGTDFLGRRRHNVLNDFAFELLGTEIRTVEEYRRPPSYYGLPWTRVVTTRPAPLDDFLLSVGGGDAYGMQRYREKALLLRKKLQTLAGIG